MTRRPAHPRTPRRGRQPSRKPRHAYLPYPASETGLDGYCQTCNLRGEPDDARHLSTDEIDAQRTYEQRRLGETDE